MGIAKPETREEEARVNAALRKKYPQMFTKEWKDAVAKARKAAAKKKPPAAKTGTVKAVKETRKKQKTALEEALTGDEIKRMMGR